MIKASSSGWCSALLYVALAYRLYMRVTQLALELVTLDTCYILVSNT